MPELCILLAWKNVSPGKQPLVGTINLVTKAGILFPETASAVELALPPLCKNSYPYHLDMGGAHIKINDDGSFNLMVGTADLGTGSDTALAQIAAEVLGVKVEDMIVTSSDTDTTPLMLVLTHHLRRTFPELLSNEPQKSCCERKRRRAAIIFC